MADTLTAAISLTVKVNKLKDLDLRDIRDPFTIPLEMVLNSGTGIGNCDLYFIDTRSLGDGASEDLDLAASLSDAFGSTITFAKVKFLAIRNNSTTQTLSVGGASANQFYGMFGASNDLLKIAPNTAAAGGGWAVLICDPVGVAVTAATADLLKVLNSGGAAMTYDIICIGATA